VNLICKHTAVLRVSKLPLWVVLGEPLWVVLGELLWLVLGEPLRVVLGDLLWVVLAEPLWMVLGEPLWVVLGDLLWVVLGDPLWVVLREPLWVVLGECQRNHLGPRTSEITGMTSEVSKSVDSHIYIHYIVVIVITAAESFVLFFSRPRLEGWPHHGRTLSIYLCPLSFWLTLPRGVLSMSWCWSSRLCVVFLPCVHLALLLALFLSPDNSIVSSWCDHSMLVSLL